MKPTPSPTSPRLEDLDFALRVRKLFEMTRHLEAAEVLAHETARTLQGADDLVGADLAIAAAMDLRRRVDELHHHLATTRAGGGRNWRRG